MCDCGAQHRYLAPVGAVRYLLFSQVGSTAIQVFHLEDQTCQVGRRLVATRRLHAEAAAEGIRGQIFDPWLVTAARSEQYPEAAVSVRATLSDGVKCLQSECPVGMHDSRTWPHELRGQVLAEEKIYIRARWRPDRS